MPEIVTSSPYKRKLQNEKEEQQRRVWKPIGFKKGRQNAKSLFAVGLGKKVKLTDFAPGNGKVRSINLSDIMGN